MTDQKFIEQRKFERFDCDGVAEVAGPAGLRFRGKILDLSLSGCFLETQPPVRLERGTHIEILFQLNGLAFRVGATISGSRRVAGSAYNFSHLSARTQGNLEALVDELTLSKDKEKSATTEPKS